jgi:glycosyltransferase involved in cell wall biosynthesis
MKVALVAPTQIPALRANTVQVMKMAQAIAILRHEVRLAVPQAGAGRDSKLTAWGELAFHYGLAHEFPIDWLPSISRLRRYDYAFHAVRWARSWGADVLYTRLPQAAALSSLLAVPTILETHDFPQGRSGPWLFQRFVKGSGACRLVAITHTLAKDLASRLGAPAEASFTIVAPDGVDLERYQNLPDPQSARLMLHSFQGRAERFTAGYSGHLYRGRGARLMLDLAERLPNITFLIVGGEPQDVARLQTEVSAHQLENVLLTGFVSNSELPLYQASCDLLLMPYQARVAASSGGDIAPYLSPMKLFEYLACGRAILSSDLPVLREVLNAENAVLLPPADLESWVEAVQELQHDAARRLALAVHACQDATRYTWEARAEKILSDLEPRRD